MVVHLKYRAQRKPATVYKSQRAFDKQQRLLKKINATPPSEFEWWCFANKREPFTDKGVLLSSMHDFLMEKDLIVSPKDLTEYPGLEHAAMLLIEVFHPSDRLPGPRLMPLSPYKALSHDQCMTLLEIMNDKLATVWMGGQFNIGQTVGDRWKIKSILVGAEGCFNRGILLVQDTLDPWCPKPRQ